MTFFETIGKIIERYSSFFAQGVVVCNRCDSGIAFFAVQSAATDQLIHKSSSLHLFILTTFFPLFLGECSCQDQHIGNRNDNQSNEMKQVHFRGKIHIIRKRTERVDSSMDEDAGEQAAAAIKDRDQQETDCDCKTQ